MSKNYHEETFPIITKRRRIDSSYTILLTRDDYTVGWVCALSTEQTAATAILDQQHEDLPKPLHDPNAYTLGSIGKHNIVIACLPEGGIGTSSAATVSTWMISTFPSIKFGLMVGIGGGVPQKGKLGDIRLGDVVVSSPSGQHPGVVQLDLGKSKDGGVFERTGSLNNPPVSLRTALTKLKTAQEMNGSRIQEYLDEMKAKWPRLADKYSRSESLRDVLFKADHAHVTEGHSNVKEEDEEGGYEDENDEGCRFCDPTKTVKRKPRDMRVHYGLIASGNRVIKDASFRDKLNRDLGGNVLCVEMEAAGLMNNFPCIVIRGICDYADSHKNKDWQPHAAAVAAAFAKELLSHVQATDVDGERSVNDVIGKDMKVIKGEVIQIRQALSDAERQRIFDWSSRTNPSNRHNLAQRQYEEGTGTWLFRHPDWKSWIDLDNHDSRCLWIHGIPGSGKTVLISHTYTKLNELLKEGQFQPGDIASSSHHFNHARHQENMSIAMVYYYCHYSRNHDEATPFLFWVINQLCRQSNFTPDYVVELHRSGRDPTSDDLLKALEACIEPYRAVFVLLDAIDESRPREALLSVIRDLVSKPQFATIKLLTSSREYDEITSSMKDISTSVSLSNVYVEADIRKYIETAIKRQRVKHFGHLSNSFLGHVTHVLASKAKGMFQWAVCQIDTIRRMRFKSEREIRDALKNLPEDLYSTYERIFELILDERRDDCTLVADALTWIAYNTKTLGASPIPVSFLLPAIYPQASSTLSWEQHRDELRDLLGCLVRFTLPDSTRNENDEFGYASLAHYTVIEYLESPHIKTGNAARFALLEPSLFIGPLFQKALEVERTDFDGWLSCDYSYHLLKMAFGALHVKFTETAKFSLPFDLTYKLLTPTLKHYAAAKFILGHEELAVTWMEFWRLEFTHQHKNDEISSEAHVLISLLFIQQLQLAEKLICSSHDRISSAPVEEFLITSFEWDIAYIGLIEDGCVKYGFNGTLPEWAALLPAFFYGEDSGKVFTFLLRRNSSAFVPKIPGLLLSVLMQHSHDPRTDSSRMCIPGTCIIKKLIRAGANLNPDGYLITPLQVAVSMLDHEAVQILLENGAEVNGTGDCNAQPFNTRNPLSRFNTLSGVSPLYICRRFPYRGPCDQADNRRKTTPLIKGTLLEYGGTEFRKRDTREVKDCEVEDEIFVSIAEYSVELPWDHPTDTGSTSA